MQREKVDQLARFRTNEPEVLIRYIQRKENDGEPIDPRVIAYLKKQRVWPKTTLKRESESYRKKLIIIVLYFSRYISHA